MSDLKIVFAIGIVGFTVLELGVGAATPVWLTLTIFGLNHFIELHQPHRQMAAVAPVSSTDRRLVTWPIKLGDWTHDLTAAGSKTLLANPDPLRPKGNRIGIRKHQRNIDRPHNWRYPNAPRTPF